MRASLEIFDLATRQARVVLQTDRLIEAPACSPDGTELLISAEGQLFRVPLARPELHKLDTGPANRCNNDHGYGRDGTEIVLTSHHAGRGAEIYMMQRSGGPLRLLSPQAPSWWHGWSPDGRVMVYAAARGQSPTVDIYTRAIAGGAEQRLTQGEGHSDGPEFSADGRKIYYNCDRDGQAQIWVMAADGTDQRALFADDAVNWFPHPSPDGHHLIWLAYPPGTKGHPRDLPVSIMLGDPAGQNRACLIAFTGGQGSMNVPNWSPDSRSFAFVRYFA